MGYLYLSLDDESSYRCGVIIEKVHQMKHLPFKLKAASSYCAPIMARVPSGFEDSALTYIDNVLIYSNDFPSHFLAIRKVLTCLREFHPEGSTPDKNAF